MVSNQVFFFLLSKKCHFLIRSIIDFAYNVLTLHRQFRNASHLMEQIDEMTHNDKNIFD